MTIHEVLDVAPRSGVAASCPLVAKPYSPDEKTKAIFRRAVTDAYFYMQQRYLTVEPDELWWPDRRWRDVFYCDANRGFSWDVEGMLDYDNRAVHPWFTAIYFPAYVAPKPATMYLATARDADGDVFEAGKTYSLTVPPDVPVKQFWSLTVTHQLLGQTERATAALHQLTEMAQGLSRPAPLAVADSCQARVALLRGESPPAAHLAPAVRTAPTAPELFLWLEVPALTRARVLVAQGREGSLEEAHGLLGSVREVTESSCFACQTIEVAVLQASVLERQGWSEEAPKALMDAMRLAAPGGWVRPFLEAGPAMAAMVERLSRRSGASAFRQQLLDAFGGFGATSAATATPAVGDAAGRVAIQPLREELTHRELDVLELLAKRLQNKEIAAQLFISTHTVSDHLKHIYQKLGVGGRRQAVRRAVELHLVDPRRSS